MAWLFTGASSNDKCREIWKIAADNNKKPLVVRRRKVKSIEPVIGV